MRQSETAKVVTAVAVYDRRVTLDEATAELQVELWHRAIGHLDYADALDAVVEYYQTTTETIMPADVIAGAEDQRRSRLAHVPPMEVLMAGVDPADPQYVATYQRRREDAAQRRTPPPDPFGAGPKALPQR